ncbi:F-box/kelch-repeat protein At3g06240-like [Alnus glutinosa]|uniref:F-box/kelch-repeat protein At3g06240-like n=1 Tax=Alnus glutinosa TaxID=3517 RepID=UPI002D7A2C81|nr:F-box/kelch-repeat protein At3g06240-like [Alnus glutinosa]XP_062152761.1 F-box/kelch-repeat protein At3g06240-like [Alnus glutinosa]XP_062152762.1 F-box/kelch-repeat protein At3g06240-like [Alnus glutinosa]XP_062152763.1 F-box/kelch-repeat protein At3g06240-like [Alnus glutinosa]XP_062152764.1 F-box/kelch-repeat protein At3g06240-like [Alnus glutinosa]XP_062152765.1 F-box/kelch-repeat protein At3g06240-like [Alnus glutinosa]
MSDRLPNEVISDILSRLPVKSLIRFRCVSKEWCSLISSPNFIAAHLNRSLSNSQHQPYLFVYDNYTIYTVLLYPSDLQVEKMGDFFANPSDRIELYDPDGEHSLHLVGSSNGLLCLATAFFDNERGSCVLWNPSIQKAISLPKPNLQFHGSFDQSVGFGYEPMTDDYKLVRLVYPRGTNHYPFIAFNDNIVSPLVEVYTLRTGIWRSVTARGPPYIIKMWSSSVFVNGALHWPANTRRNQNPFRNVIVWFNMKDEAFGEVGMPESLQGVEYLDVRVFLVDGLLALVPRVSYGNEASQAVWVMKEYGAVESWSKLFDIRIGGFERVIGFTKSDEVLLQKGQMLYSFSPSSRGYLDLPIRCPDNIHLDTHVESLLLLSAADRVLR